MPRGIGAFFYINFINGLAISLSGAEDLIDERDKLLAEGDVDKASEKAGHIRKILEIVEEAVVFGK